MDASRVRDAKLRATAPDMPVRLDPAACLTALRPGAPCTACADACPDRAIRISDRHVEVDSASCSGCGHCAPSCPTGAIDVAGFSPASAFECARADRTAAGARTVACLAGLTGHTLRRAIKDGDVTLIDHGWCAECPLSRGRAAPWTATVAMVNNEMQALGRAERVIVHSDPVPARRARPEPRPATENPDRRGLFNRFVQGDTARTQDDPLSLVPGKVRAPGPWRRAAALTALAPEGRVPRSLFPALVRADAPADLNALAMICPTPALALRETQDGRALVFDARACIRCDACTASGALSFQPDPDGDFTGAVTLTTEPRATCRECRMRFTPKGRQRTCAACARDTDLASLAHGLMRRRPTEKTEFKAGGSHDG